jgi:DNA repair photolyase
MELREGDQFETEIFAKQFDPARFRRELRALPRGDGLAIGTATDPYQPAERRFEVTRRMLEVIAKEGSWSIGLTTKSDLPPRDIDLLQQISQRNRLNITFTITTVDRELARLTEPKAPRPDLRLAAVKALSEAGVCVSVFASPIMPLINDSEPALLAVAKAAHDHGAQWFGGRVLFLKPCAKAVFLPFVEQNYPQFARRYRERYEDRSHLNGAYPDMIEERVKKVRALAGFGAKPEIPIPEKWEDDPQLPLFAA